MLTVKSMDITLPSKYKTVSSDGNTAVFEVEHLYPGYGTTLGNALRRVLLSSLKGAAVTMVKIKGVNHEFSTVPNVIEDVVEIILNLKQVRFKLDGDEPQHVHIKVKGEKEVTAKDIETPSQVKVINGNAPIASITDKKGELEIEMTIEKGLGYVPVEQRRKEKLEIGAIAVDAIFTPIRKVNYEVENMRVGDRTDFNKLKLTIETDGSIDPESAFNDAVGILVNQFTSITSSATEAESFMAPEKTESAEAIEEDVTKVKIEEMDLSTRTINSLTEGGIKTVGGLTKKTESGLREVEGMGDVGIKEIKKALSKLDLSLKEE